MIRQIDVTSDEVRAGKLSAENLAAALEGLHEDGAIVLHDVIDPSHIALLREKMEADIPELVRRVRINMSKGQFHHSPPPFAPYVFLDVVANPIVTSVCEAAIQSPVQLSFLSGNTNLPGSEAQALHRDIGNLWAAMDFSHPPSMLSVHIPLVDMGPANGGTEIWPGTHRLAHLDGNAGYGLGPDGKPVRAPEQPTCRAGGVLLRDARGWHRAMPNTTEEPRVMLGLVYSAIWRRAGKIVFMESARPALADATIPLNAIYVDEPFDYLEDWRDRQPVRPPAAAGRP